MKRLYVVYENGEERHISQPFSSILECIEFVNHARAVDRKLKFHYNYFIVEHRVEIQFETDPSLTPKTTSNEGNS